MDGRVNLFTMLGRGLEYNYISHCIEQIYKYSGDSNGDLFVMAFYARDIRGGKGERKLFYDFMRALYVHDKATVCEMIYLIPEYGCWRDMWELLRLIPELETDILEMVYTTFRDDFIQYYSNKQTSLLAKWLPREKSNPTLARKIADFIYKSEPSRRTRIIKYRKDVSMLNKTIKPACKYEMPYELPYELVRRSLNPKTTPDEHFEIQRKWNEFELDGLKEFIPMCDFSQSMKGIPKLVSLAVGILISEITHDAFKDHILTFDYEPQWHSFVDCNTLKDKLNSIHGLLGQSYKTDFYKASLLILNRLKEYAVPAGQEPKFLIVLTDMGFDLASDGVDHFKEINSIFCNSGYEAPRIIIWNVRNEYKDFYINGSLSGQVIQLSGWSHSIFKMLQNIEAVTPYECMRHELDSDRYDEVRRVFHKVRT